MQEKDDVLIRKTSVPFRHLFADEELDPRIKRVDLRIDLNDFDVLRQNRMTDHHPGEQSNRPETAIHVTPSYIVVWRAITARTDHYNFFPPSVTVSRNSVIVLFMNATSAGLAADAAKWPCNDGITT